MRNVSILIFMLAFYSSSWANEPKIIPTKTFEAECKIKSSKSVSYNLGTGYTTTGNTLQLPKGDVKINSIFDLAKSGEIHNYTKLRTIESTESQNILEMSFIDHLPLITDKEFAVTDSSGALMLSLKRVYKNEWYGLLTNFAFRENYENEGDAYDAFVTPLKCIGEFSP